MHPISGSVSAQPGRRLRLSIFLSIFLCLFLLFSAPAFSQKSIEAGQIAESQKIQTAREANDRIAQLALVESTNQGDYVIGAGDLLGIEVFDVPELSRDVRVNETGFVALPLIPVKIQAGGLTQ